MDGKEGGRHTDLVGWIRLDQWILEEVWCMNGG